MSNNYTEYEINDNRNKTLSVEENLNKIRPYLQDIINDLKKHLSRHQTGLETSKKGGKFLFDYVHLLYYKCHKINFKRGGSYIDSPDWIKNKKSNNLSYK